MTEMTLAQLLPEIGSSPLARTPARQLVLDSRKIQPGDTFVALVGQRFDGRDCIPDAIARGAASVLVEADERWHEPEAQQGVPILPVNNLQARLSAMAGRLYDEPSQKTHLVGITGTNGKTTCSLLLAQLVAAAEGRAAVVGTLGYGVFEGAKSFGIQVDDLTSTGLTTPDAIGSQEILSKLAARKPVTTAMEVSSHSLVQHRVEGLAFDTAIFTNLTHDHLDYHGDMTRYGQAKERLLHLPGLSHAIVNLDDDWAGGLLERLPSGVQGLSYSLDNPEADVHLEQRVDQRSGVSALLATPWGKGELHTGLLGRFNLSNLLGVITAAAAQGVPLSKLLEATPRLQPAPGRMQPVVVDEGAQDVQVIVDYAHTPDALKNSLQAAQAHNTGRLWCVFGCGGDRDKHKRPLMGRLAEQHSDFAIVTNDNPRSEDPGQIAADIVGGMHNPNHCLVIADRAQAIDLAIQQARAGDTLLIAGKGHENDQVFADRTLAFSDIDQARNALMRRLKKQEVAS